MSFTRDVFNKAQPNIPFSSTRTAGANLLSKLSGRSSPVHQMAAMGNVGTLFAIVTRLANATSQVEWKLYRKSDGRGRIAGSDSRKEVTVHAALDLWNKPNPFYTRQSFVEAYQQHQELVGESDWVLLRDPRFDFPIEMWPVRPDRLIVNPSPTDFIKDYTYVGPTGERINLKKNEVIQLKLPNPLDPYRGMGPVQSILADLDGVKYSAEWNRNFFLNSAEPGGVIQVDKRLSDDEFNEMSQRWNEQHKGVSKAHRVALIEQGTWVNNAFSQRDMQFVQLREVSRDTIMEAFSFNKMMLGVVDDVNRASAEASEYVFAKYHMVSRLERTKQALNTQLLPMFGTAGEGLEFDYCNPVPADVERESAELKSRVDTALSLISAGFNPDEVFMWLDLPQLTLERSGNAQPENDTLPS